jgi:hypothetical protein
MKSKHQWLILGILLELRQPPRYSCCRNLISAYKRESMDQRFHRIEARGVAVVLDMLIGNIRSFEIDAGGKILRPLHTAPWVDEEIEDPSLPSRIRFLSGDFFCAPFSENDITGAQRHGPPANSEWRRYGKVERSDGAIVARYELAVPVEGATLVKELTLRDGHPFLYQRHVFTGGHGRIPVSNHAMAWFGSGGGSLSFSKKWFGELPATVQEPDPALGRSIFKKSVRFEDTSRMPLENGALADLHRYPVADRHEDFVTLVEKPDTRLGWTAAVRADVGDMMLSLKNPMELPITCLWYSNGGRYYAPWNGRHVGVLGIEEGRSYLNAGHKASTGPNAHTAMGIPTALDLSANGKVSVRHVLGGLPANGWRGVRDIAAEDKSLRLQGDDGSYIRVPFDGSFLAS